MERDSRSIGGKPRAEKFAGVSAAGSRGANTSKKAVRKPKK